MTHTAEPKASQRDWYKDAVIYQVHIRSFCDGSGDGNGDFKGLISKLDYLENLGVTALWLLPFYPSPLKDDGYDIADYQRVHPDYGTLADFKKFLKEAHARGLKVISELVLNHTSDQHAWFQRARRAKPGSAYRDFYVWSDTPDKYSEARIIFQDFERSNWTWDPVAKAYFWHRFYSHQPDLNFDNPRVHKALYKVLDFWFDLGVDGMRLDAVPYLYEREGTNCENLPETYEFLKNLRAHIDAKYPGRMLLAEANQWPEDAAKYFGDGDACNMAFHFPLMPRMFMALEMENRYPVIDILEQTPKIPESAQWALFLRNHDELTLEMVTDEERDYMYRIFVKDPRARINLGIRRRLAPLLDNDRRKIELMNVLLMTLPGSPVVYYGDEIGMGDNFYLGDRDGVRTPMQWSANMNAGFSEANPQKLYLPLVIDPEYHYESLNVSTQESRRSSLLWWMRHVIDLRKLYSAFGRGGIEFLSPENPKVLTYLRKDEEQTILVVANLSHHAQMVTLDLSAYEEHTPRDIFSRNDFAPVADSPYTLSLTPYGFFVFHLTPPAQEAESGPAPKGLPAIAGKSWWTLLDSKPVKRDLEKKILPRYLCSQRWFGGKSRKIREVSVLEWIHIRRDLETPLILLVEVAYQEGTPEIYILPLAYAPRNGEEEYETPTGAMAWLTLEKSQGAVYEAVYSKGFLAELLSIIAGRKRLSAKKGKLMAEADKELKKLWRQKGIDLSPRLLGAEQSNTSILYGENLILKLYRRTEIGAHPDVEIARFLSEKAGLTHIPPYRGSVEFRLPGGEAIVLGLMQGFVPNQGDARKLFVDLVSRYFDRVLTMVKEGLTPPKEPASLLEAGKKAPPAPLDELFSPVTMEVAELLGRRTAEMHLALGSGNGKSFSPEPFTTLYQRALFQSMQTLARQELRALKRCLPTLSGQIRDEAREVVGLEKTLVSRMRGLTTGRIKASKIRIHGDYHLGQVLYTGKDFVIFDFEGDPSRPLSERRLKRSPIQDVAGMIYSFSAVAYSRLLGQSTVREKDVPVLVPWADLWYQFVSGVFLRGYFDAMQGSAIIPSDQAQLDSLLTAYLLGKAVHELGCELCKRPEWLTVPLRGIKYLCGE